MMNKSLMVGDEGFDGEICDDGRDDLTLKYTTRVYVYETHIPNS
jgi:hypothetical protein